MIRTLTLLLPAVVVLLVACDLFAPADGPALDGDWQLERGTHAGQPIPMVPNAPITLAIDGQDVGGVAACNQYGGTLERDGSEVSFGALAMTEMGCDPQIMASESAYVAALGDVEQASRSGDALTLTGADVELVFTLVPPVPDAELVGTTWQLVSVISGESVSSVVGDPAPLELQEDGTLGGSTGCRTFAARYELGDDRVSITDLASDRRACPDGMIVSQDEHVLDVIDEGFTFQIDGDSLTVTDGDAGLGYRAADG